MYKVLIVEDFPDDAALLEEELQRYGQRHHLEFSVEKSPFATALTSGSRTFDLVFLDIELPGISGMEAAQLMRSYDTSTPIVFTTSLAQYAARSYEVEASGFIVKPVTGPKLEMCMDKIVGRLRRAGEERLVLPTGGGLRVIPLRDLRYVELVHHDLVFHLAGDHEPLRLRGTIKQVAEKVVEGGPLLQISSGCVVNMDYVRAIRGFEVEMEGGEVLPLSRSRKRPALEALSSYMGGVL